ncbi:hypothetical protein BKA64DRAFT_218609 [Cadophora sp. MPI-SDFR-AT-0126]|nr:hypothetical protein BKA64DRAFT_218609 [Leotiomycetes sp. MPI-SDFR-AT-0126]
MSATLQPVDSQKRPLDLEKDEPRSKRMCNPAPAPNLVGPQPIVTVKVRADQNPTGRWHTFQVHKNYLCHYSPYFRAALSGPFIESEDQSINLDETNPTVFGILVNWLYTQTLVNKSSEQPLSSHLFMLWILADKLLIPRLQNDILSMLESARKTKGLPSAVFGYVYENTTEESLLRKYIVSMCLAKTEAMKDPDHYPRELLLEIVAAVRRREKEAVMRRERGQWRPDLEEFFVDEREKGVVEYRRGQLANVSQEEPQ